MNSTLDNLVLTVETPRQNKDELLSSFAPFITESDPTIDGKIIPVNDGTCDDLKRILERLDPSPHLRYLLRNRHQDISMVCAPITVSLDVPVERLKGRPKIVRVFSV